MLIDRYAPEDVFARVPELAEQTDPVLRLWWPFGSSARSEGPIPSQRGIVITE